MLETWNGEEYKQVRENRTLVEKASAIISQKAYTLVGQAIDKTLRNGGLGVIDRRSEDGKRSRGSLGASAGENEVSVLGYPAWMRRTERVPIGCQGSDREDGRGCRRIPAVKSARTPYKPEYCQDGVRHGYPKVG